MKVKVQKRVDQFLNWMKIDYKRIYSIYDFTLNRIIGQYNDLCNTYLIDFIKQNRIKKKHYKNFKINKYTQ
jgi:hypothetical protein